jgi:hypothetical protein
LTHKKVERGWLAVLGIKKARYSLRGTKECGPWSYLLGLVGSALKRLQCSVVFFFRESVEHNENTTEHFKIISNLS